MRLFVGYCIVVFLMSSCKPHFEHLSTEKNERLLTTEALLENSDYSSRIEAFYDTGKDGFFKGREGVDIYYSVFQQKTKPENAILISSGRTEAAIKYKELIFDLFNNGYSVYIMDHRGQGQSGRMNEDPDLGYVEDFQYYIDDLKFFRDSFMAPSVHKNTYLLAHSMGGAIGVTYLEQHPNDFDAAAFSSPMLGLKSGICLGAKALEPEKPKYGLGEGVYNDDKVRFKHNHLTGSKIRYQRMVEAFDKVPAAKLGGASYQWVVRSCDQFEYINSHLDKISTPLILFSAENEQIVSLKAHQKFIDRLEEMGKPCQAFLIENAQHELLIEKDPQRIETINHVLSFFETYQD